MQKAVQLLILLNSFSVVSQGNTVESTFNSNGHLRNDPIFHSFKVCKHKNGKSFIVIKYVGDGWWLVDNKKCVGYVHSAYINLTMDLDRIAHNHEINIEQEPLKKRRDSLNNTVAVEIKRLKEKRKNDSLRQIKIEAELKKEVEENKIKDQEVTRAYRTACYYTLNEIDEFDNVLKIKTRKMGIGSGVYISLIRIGSLKYVFFSTSENLGCASPYSNNRSYVKVKLINSKIITFYHTADVDCSGFKLYGKLLNSEIESLNKSPIKSIRLNGTDYYQDAHEIDFPDYFINQLKCIKSQND